MSVGLTYNSDGAIEDVEHPTKPGHTESLSSCRTHAVQMGLFRLHHSRIRTTPAPNQVCPYHVSATTHAVQMGLLLRRYRKTEAPNQVTSYYHVLYLRGSDEPVEAPPLEDLDNPRAKPGVS